MSIWTQCPPVLKRYVRAGLPAGRKGSIMRICILIAVVIPGNIALGQTNRYIQQGNKFYEQQKYKEAANDYARALSKDPTNIPGLFNFGNSLYQQRQYDSSRKVMEATAKMAKNPAGKAAAHYNIGNSYMSQQKWEDAINAYKNTLRNNPQDADAKYNLSYAEEMLKQQQNQDKDKKNQDKQNKDQKDKDKQNQQDKDNKDKDKQDKDQKDNQDKKEEQDKDQQPQSQPGKLSQQQAEQLLNALQQEEKKLQDKMKKEKGTPVKMQKDW
ncbi:MAG: tetratricopeptide repeat protein [Chitinophagales bacterium]